MAVRAPSSARNSRRCEPCKAVVSPRQRPAEVGTPAIEVELALKGGRFATHARRARLAEKPRGYCPDHRLAQTYRIVRPSIAVRVSFSARNSRRREPCKAVVSPRQRPAEVGTPAIEVELALKGGRCAAFARRVRHAEKPRGYCPDHRLAQTWRIVRPEMAVRAPSSARNSRRCEPCKAVVSPRQRPAEVGTPAIEVELGLKGGRFATYARRARLAEKPRG